MLQSLEKILLAIIHIGIILALFAPLIITSGTIFPYVVGKAIFFRILVEIIFAAWIILILINSRFKPKLSIISIGLGIFFLSLIISSIAGINPYHSFWSNFERSEGLITLFHLGAFFLVLSSVLKEGRDWQRLFRFSLAVSIFMSLYALGQKLGSQLPIYFMQDTSIGGSTGNSSFLAAYLLFHIFIAFTLYFQERKSSWKIFYVFTIIFNILIMLFTGTRGAALGFGVGVMVFFILAAIFSQEKKLRRYFVGALLILFLSGSLIFIFRGTSFVQKIPTIGRVANISLTKGTAQTRITSWGISLEGWKERFWLGWGPENYNVVFFKHFNPKYLIYGGGEVFDRAHNIIFDRAVTGGIFGLLSYLFLLAAPVFILLRKLWKKEISFIFASGFIALIIGYFIQNIFVFDTLNTYLPFFMVLGFLHFLFGITTEEHKYQRNFTENSQNAYRKIVAAGILMAIFLPYAIYKINIKPAVAANYTRNSWALALNNKFDESFQIAREAIDADIYRDDGLRLTVSKGAFSAIQANKIKDEDFTFIDDLLRNGFEQFPGDIRFNLHIAKIYNMLGRKNNSFLFKSEEILNEALKWAPNSFDIRYELAVTKIYQNKPEEAIDLLKKTVDLLPGYGRSYWNLAEAYYSASDYELAISNIEKAKEFGYDYKNPNNLLLLGNLYSKIGSNLESVRYYEELVNLNPNEAQFYTYLAVAYAEAGEKEKAREAALKAAELNPSFKEGAEEFLKSYGL